MLSLTSQYIRQMKQMPVSSLALTGLTDLNAAHGVPTVCVWLMQICEDGGLLQRRSTGQPKLGPRSAACDARNPVAIRGFDVFACTSARAGAKSQWESGFSDHRSLFRRLQAFASQRNRVDFRLPKAHNSIESRSGALGAARIPPARSADAL